MEWTFWHILLEWFPVIFDSRRIDRDSELDSEIFNALFDFLSEEFVFGFHLNYFREKLKISLPINSKLRSLFS